MRETNCKTVTLVVPCFHEAEGLGAFMARCELVAAGCAGHRFEYLFVDDGSADGTWAEVGRLAGENDRVRGVRLARNYGQQRAISAGLDMVDSDYVVILDADLQDPPELIPALLERLDGGCDLVHTVRTDRSSDSAFKRWSAWAFYQVMRRWVLPGMPENAGDYKAFNRRVLDAVRLYRERVRFLRGSLATVGFEQATVGYTRPVRHAGTSKYPLRKMLRLARDAVFSNTALPLRWCVYVGLLVIGLWPIAALAGLALNGLDFVTVALLVQWLVGGMLLVGLGLAGEYLRIIVLEVKARPLYLVRDTVNLGGSDG